MSDLMGQSPLLAHAQLLMAVAFALPCFLMAARLWQVWRDPLSIEGGAWVNLGVGVFVMEFILGNAGVLLAGVVADTDSRVAGWGGFVLVTLFYGLFAGVIALAFKSRMLLHSFLWLIGARCLALLVGLSAESERLLHAHAVTALVIYFAMVVLSVMLPWPRFGITAELATRLRDPAASGLWVDEPHRAIGAATVYFVLLGLAEVVLLSWMDPRHFL